MKKSISEIKLTSADCRSINLALMTGDTNTLFELLSNYLSENQLELPPAAEELYWQQGSFR